MFRDYALTTGTAVAATVSFLSIAGVLYWPSGPPPASINNLHPTRMFSGPSQFPPTDFPAYGIVAFKGDPTAASKDRYAMICDAYVHKIDFQRTANRTIHESFVLVWPIDTDALADDANDEPRATTCIIAVNNYGSRMADEALANALAAGFDTENRSGPFLLGWSPSSDKGEDDALLIVADMSGLSNPMDIELAFDMWKRDVMEGSDAISFNDWNPERLAFVLKVWANQFGPNVLRLIGVN